MPKDGNTADQQPPARVLTGPTRVDGQVSRLIETLDGGGQVQTWTGDGWRAGGANVAEVLKGPPASVQLLDQLGVPASDR